MLIDSKKSGLSIGNETSSGISGGDWFSLGAAALDAGVDIFNNERNINLQKQTNSQNEALMRESWLRDDTAVQRRVADLKAAGLSPTLAAGSAASNSGPVTLSAPKSNLKGGYGAQTLAALSAVKALKQQDLQNELLQKQINNYGKPDWFVALHEIFGTDRFEQILHGLGDWLYDTFVPSGSRSSGSRGGLPGSSEDPNTQSPIVSGYVEPVVHMTFHDVPVSEILNSDDEKGTTAWTRDNMLKDRDHIIQNRNKYFDSRGSYTQVGEQFVQKFAKRYSMSYNDAARLISDWIFDYF